VEEEMDSKYWEEIGEEQITVNDAGIMVVFVSILVIT
jgi:hypothetical protein